jgi:two-component system, OmpR family, response regulator MprA
MLIADDDLEGYLRTRDPVGQVGGPAASPWTPRVLVVDGDGELREAAAARLRAAGFAVRTAADGLDALYALGREAPDLVVLDLELPVVSGFRLLHLLKHAGAGAAPPPVLVLTALSFEEAREAAYDGADDFVAKPPAPGHLEACVRRLLDARRPAAAADGARRLAVAA